MSTLKAVLNAIGKPRAIVVTGPQRSGTTIAAHIIADELGYRYVDEDEFGIHDLQRAEKIVAQGFVVIQAPGLMYCAEQFAKSNACIIVMRREINEIRNSEARINWRTAYDGKNVLAEQVKYNNAWNIRGGDDPVIKYQVWDRLQSRFCVSYNVEYESLREYKQWRDERKDYAPRQWTEATA